MTIDRRLGRLLLFQLPNHFKSYPFNEKFSLSLIPFYFLGLPNYYHFMVTLVLPLRCTITAAQALYHYVLDVRRLISLFSN